MTRSGEERWLASQSVSTIQFLADFGKEHPVAWLGWNIFRRLRADRQIPRASQVAECRERMPRRIIF
jgi:hypothetical protein